MTTMQLAMRLCENLTVRDWAKLPLNEAEKLREAMTTGLLAFSQLLPTHRQTRPERAIMRAPLSQTINIVSGASEFAYVAGGGAYPAGGYAVEEDALGNLALLAGSPYLNRLILPGELLIPNLGLSGNTTMTLYGDAARMGSSIWQIIGNPRWLSSALSQTLQPAPQGWEVPFTIQTGTPQYWWTEELAGATRASGPMWLLRVWPVPVAIGALEMKVSSFPTAVTFLDLHDEARALPVTKEEEPLLVSLCEEALLKHPLWREDVERSEIRQSANAARLAMEQRNRPMDTTPRRVGTPKGW